MALLLLRTLLKDNTKEFKKVLLILCVQFNEQDEKAIISYISRKKIVK